MTEVTNIKYDAETRRRFEAKIRANDRGCWVWQAHIDGDGYGQFKLDGRAERAHRAAWMLYRGDIAPGMEIDHTCVTPSCVNPDHLEVVTHTENMRRIRQRNRPDWATEDDEDEDEPSWKAKPISPEIVLQWARDLMDRYEHKLGEPLAIHLEEGAPWREYGEDFEQGLLDKTNKFALAALFLYAVQMGANWRNAAPVLLGMSPVSLKRWNHNAAWKEDFADAKKKGRGQRWVDLEDTILDTAERNVSRWEGKDVVNLLKVVDHRHERKAAVAIRKGGELPLLGGGNTYVFNFPANMTPEELVEGTQRVIETTARDVTDEPAPDTLPPPEDWEEDFGDD